MNAKEKALKYLSRHHKHHPEGYDVIDPLIEPLCKLLSSNGYLTLHSCSTHVKVRSYKLSRFIKDLSEEEDMRVHHKYLQWYIMFVATIPIADIRRVIQTINEKYGYGLYYYKAKSFEGITRRWVIEKMIDPSYKQTDVYELNKNIYLEFKSYFEKKES